MDGQMMRIKKKGSTKKKKKKKKNTLKPKVQTEKVRN